MDIEWFRDLAIIIFTLTATTALIVFVILVYRGYRELKVVIHNINSILVSTRNISRSVENTVIQAETIGKFFAKIITLTKSIHFITNLFRKKEDEK